MMEVILWNNEGSSDKLWGVVSYKSDLVTFWGRRTGNDFAFKLLTHSEAQKVDKLIEKKRKKRGYRSTTFEELESLRPDFRDDFEYMLTMCIMGDDFRKV